jgi:hypothetical protein
MNPLPSLKIKIGKPKVKKEKKRKKPTGSMVQRRGEGPSSLQVMTGAQFDTEVT